MNRSLLFLALFAVIVSVAYGAACGTLDANNDNCKDPTNKDKYCKCIGTAGYPNCDCPTDAMGKQVCEGIKTAVTSLGCPAPVMPQQGAALTQPTAGAITHAAPVMPQQGAAMAGGTPITMLPGTTFTQPQQQQQPASHLSDMPSMGSASVASFKRKQSASAISDQIKAFLNKLPRAQPTAGAITH